MSHQRERFNPVAALLAAVLPGLGHAYLREFKRAALVALGVLGLFVSGLLIGGVDVIDREENPVWFIGQALVGPLAFGVDRLHQNYYKITEQRTINGVPVITRRAPNPNENPRYRKSFGRVNELGTLFVAVAGMLNLLIIIDAAFRIPSDNDPALLHARRLLRQP